jgi:hypothetical protein
MIVFANILGQPLGAKEVLGRRQTFEARNMQQQT